MKVLVTGAGSGLGRSAVAYLVARGIPVRATADNPALQPLFEKMGAEFIQADLTGLVSSQARAMLTGVDTLWHCSSFMSPWGPQKIFDLANVRAIRRLGEWAAAWGIANVVHVSSPALYFDYHHHRMIQEDYRPYRYANAFARSKAESEAVIQQLAEANPSTRFIILRPQSVFGPHDNVFLPRLVTMMRHYGSIILPRGGKAVVDMTYVENAVHAMWLATVQKNLVSGRAYNITNDEPQQLQHIVAQLIDQLAIPCRIRSVPYRMLDLIARSMERIHSGSPREPLLTHYGVSKLHFDFTLDISRAKSELGYQPQIPLAEGIRRSAVWLKDHGPLHRL